MLTEEQRERVCVVLVRARNPNNIGAVARAMHGFGFADLRLVNDYSVALDKARSAVDASAILAGAQEFANVRRCSGRTANSWWARPRWGNENRSIRFTRWPRAAACCAAASAADGAVALLFGSEKTGLSNDAMSHCHWLMTIPMHQSPDLRHASMNLGQAAAVCLYELIRQSGRAAAEQTAAMAQTQKIWNA